MDDVFIYPPRPFVFYNNLYSTYLASLSLIVECKSAEHYQLELFEDKYAKYESGPFLDKILFKICDLIENMTVT